jgi:hypothetical protein
MPKRVRLWLQRLGRTFAQCGDAAPHRWHLPWLASQSARFGQRTGAPFVPSHPCQAEIWEAA